MKYFFLIIALGWFALAVTYAFSGYDPGKFTTTIAYLLCGIFSLLQFDNNTPYKG